MPELPEVEIVRRNLARWTDGRVLVGIQASELARVEGALGRLLGRRVVGWRRRGKLLIGELDGGVGLLSHLGMTGKWVRDPGQRPSQRIRLRLDSGATVAMVDPRRLGRVWIVDAAVVATHPRLSRLGVDPLVDGLDGAILRARVGGGGGGRASLKARLLDQGRVAGFGNITVCEGCFRARIHPHTPVGALAEDAWAALAAGLLAHIHDTLARDEGDEVRYRSERGAKAASPFAVYGRAGQPCPRCGQTIVRSTLGGRPTFVCPACQP